MTLSGREKDSIFYKNKAYLPSFSCTGRGCPDKEILRAKLFASTSKVNVMDRTWKTKQLEHESFPLFIRYPEDNNLPINSKLFPSLAVITHHLSEVTNNGLPDADYNDALFAFDKCVRDAFESAKLGTTVLIETFAGKRNYYIYTILGIDIAAVLEVTINLYPKNKISWLTRSDPEWDFIKRYSDEILKT